MGKYIKYYDTHSEYDGEKDLLDLPNVAWCEQEEDVHYKPEDYYLKQYLTFDIVSNGTISFSLTTSGTSYARVIQYSINGGETWEDLNNNLYVNSGQKVLFKGNYTYYSIQNDSTHTTAYYKFGGTATFNAYGNIMSMIGGDNFRNTNTFDEYAFRYLFRESNIISARNLVLPVMTLTGECYVGMFLNCSNLTTAPILPATTLVNYCYSSMFQGCSSLNYIKAMFTTTPSSTYTNNWVNGVSSTGTFVKNSAAQWDVSGTHGIPTGWTVVTTDI